VGSDCSERQEFPPLVAGRWSLVTGFTLIEILIAIGILSVGLLCAAAMFPAAVKENQNSFSNSMGSLICENGLAILRGKMRHDEMSVSSSFVTLDAVPMKTGTSPRNFLGKDGRYPSGAADATWTGMGFTGVIRNIGTVTAPNQYEVTVVSYSLVESATTSIAKTRIVTGTLANDTMQVLVNGKLTNFDISKFTVSSGDRAWFQRDALIVLYVGNDVVTARVSHVANNDVCLDRRLNYTGSATACVVAEVKKSADTTPLALPSPVMSVVTTRMAL